jgi:mono/diheme cytochrome c family protein
VVPTNGNGLPRPENGRHISNGPPLLGLAARLRPRVPPVTEIPEHLLKRSQERRSALGLGGDAGDAPTAAATPTESASPAVATEGAPPAAPPPIAPAEVAPAEPEPVPPYVEAALRRKRIPIWAMPALAALPVWAIVYSHTLEPPSLGASDPLSVGQAVYASNCATCHGSTGGGGVGPQLADGNVLDTFADPADQIEWVTLGSQGFSDAGHTTYGDNNTPIGAGGMPAWDGALTPEEIVAVVYYERTGLSGEEPNPALIDPTGALLVDGQPVTLSAPGGTHH